MFIGIIQYIIPYFPGSSHKEHVIKKRGSQLILSYILLPRSFVVQLSLRMRMVEMKQLNYIPDGNMLPESVSDGQCQC